METLKVGILGCGAISPAYFNGLKPYAWVEVAACADLDKERARARAKEFGVPRACSVDELLASPGVDLIINLTIPAAHAEMNRRTLEAGKHPYVEKPFATTPEDGRKVLALAAEKGLRTGSAPDTFLGGGIQTAIKLLRDGAIGRPLHAFAAMACRGHETWHPSPVFYYQPGGGPLWDMGPYYLTALINLLGPVRSVSAEAAIGIPERTVTSQPLAGTKVNVEVPTHYSGTLRFESGALATVVMSFEVAAHHLPRIEIYGEEGTMVVPDPNTFHGPVLIKAKGRSDWEEVALTHCDAVARGTGVADMAKGILAGRPHRASGELGQALVEIMAAFDLSGREGRRVEVPVLAEVPDPLPAGLALGEID
ncbi:MAG: gfo/Idh/MocA family oxidoreductase [Puniceicoccaceae bacterium]|nr:MAG: gfo/Idh/MocA family oxidoreductase [Puniceicoccaceae bacterium]